jgi:glycosyltransferase involved in cell wall biosynthesis
MSKPKVLYVCHNHPSVRPGGAEAYALELYHGIRARDEFEPIFLAKGGPPHSAGRSHPGTVFGLCDGDPNQYFVYTDGYEYDQLYGTMTDKVFCTKNFHEFLLAFRPSVVHFQHTFFLGYDTIRQVRNTLGDVPIVYTLHEYLPICHRQGQMVRTVNNDELCDHETPQRCHECFPQVSPQVFFMRKRFIQSHLSLVDTFLAPSRFLQQRFIEWGLPEDRIRFEEYGRQPMAPLTESNQKRPRNRFGFFGQLNPYKGIDLVLNAMRLLGEEREIESPILETVAASRKSSRTKSATAVKVAPRRSAEPHLWVHGANLDIQLSGFRNEIRSLLEATRENVTFVGKYDHDDLPRLMDKIDWVVVPSTWWENSPLVIQEAFGHGKPIICSDIGGMAEKVTDGVNGLHFHARDPEDLAQRIKEAATTPGLWDRLRKGIPPVYQMNRHVDAVTDLYHELLTQKSASR